jgi:glycosyltransferase involved in cell wall biosynthesis
MNKETDKTILYINFAPYTNTGRILDYLLQNFSTVISIQFTFHTLGSKGERTEIAVYKDKKCIETKPILQTPTNPSLVFILLPIRSAIIFIQLLFYGFYLKRKYRRIDYFLTVNGFIAWCGKVLKSLGIVDKTIFWVWDYYPPLHKNPIIKIMRWLYWQFDKAAIHSDKVIFLTNRLRALNTLAQHLNPKDFPVLGIGTTPRKSKKAKRIEKITLAFLGTLKRSQGLDMIFDSDNELIRTFKGIHINVFGSGPDEQYFKKRALHSSIPVNFYGYIEDINKLQDLIANSTIGIALYKPEPSNVSYYGDPSKIKAYLCESLPVISTDTFEFSKEIKACKAGIIIRYGDTEGLITAIQTIMKEYGEMSHEANSLAEKYSYQNLYSGLFDFRGL